MQPLKYIEKKKRYKTKDEEEDISKTSLKMNKSKVEKPWTIPKKTILKFFKN